MKYLNNPKLILILIILLGAFLRLYKLDWGDGLFAHPDEYHIAISVNQLNFPNQMHPHFFSYGTVIIYTIYFTKTILTFLSEILNFPLSIINSFILGRFYSAIFSTLTILLVYFTSKLIFEKKYALIAAFLVAITPGLIQQAHFATPESILTFFIFSAILFFLYFLRGTNVNYLFFASVFLGLGIGTKIVAALIFPVIFLGLFIKFFKSPLKFFLYLLIFILTVFIILTVTSPFVFLDYTAWKSSFNYENSVARGTNIVFYTRQFVDTIPILFQLEKILPYALGLSLTSFGILGIVFSIFSLFKKFDIRLLIILLSFFVIFIPHTLLFAKWTRFIAPVFPFFSIFSIYFISSIPNKFNFLKRNLVYLLCLSTSIWSLMFFSIYLKPDVRRTADNWVNSNLPVDSTYLLESGNTIDLPLSSKNKISLDFYNLENDTATKEKIINTLTEYNYFIIQSRRVFMNHQRLPNLYPKTAKFYAALFSGILGFGEIKEFHSYPAIPIPGITLEFPDESAEETWSVFDHPVIRIYQKNVRYSREDYAKILED